MSAASLFETHFFINLNLYPTEAGGRKASIAREGFSCPCKLDKDSNTIADCRLALGGQQIAPGETKRVGIRFLRDEDAATFHAAGHFYIWDGRIIGEAVVASPLRVVN